MQSETVLTGGRVVDGTGGPSRRADLVLRQGRISGVLPPGNARTAGAVVDVDGLVVAPGFIDMHSHSDLAVLADPAHEAKTLQGVTLEVLGQDGLGYAPVTDDTVEELRAQLAGWNGRPRLDHSWRTVGEYLDRIDAGSPVNAACLVPQGNVRMMVVGGEDRPPTPGELDRMRRIVAQGMDDGAHGLSTGLTYTPGMYATDDEITALLAPVHAAGGYYCPHHRNYGSRVVESYQECLEVARRAHVALHLAHCHVNFPRNRGRAPEVLDAIDEATVRYGLDVTLDSYPYRASATHLGAPLPGWAQAGGTAATLERLRDAPTRARILHEIEVEGTDGNHGVPMDWSAIVVTGVGDPALSWAVGSSVADLAEKRGEEPAGLYADLLVADELRGGCLLQVGNEENIRTIMRHSSHTAGSDGILAGAKPHPRGWGTFPRYLGHYVRELGVLTLEECVRHLTSRPARRLGLTDRGVVQTGAVADLVVFDPDTVAARATYEEPRLAPQGIHHVLVSGEFTVRDGHRTDRLPGRSVRRNR
ncbi:MULTISPECIES: N-acyl-D-amino-acid deacylase family protein [Nocardiopsis]|uniref:N-acyl-D-amino-acid deacylase n=1 Tax=Nocardiopsis sinuspersici TaxID=501010 RepID=A0A1V3C593_9ACTN|nr:MULTISPECIES: D-aminoacylase [Nocardiopsis]NYH52369.1 N-acyl-D-amino-acid deacylase [Nocardiopsis sinuspersici]OOC55863.1 N-acyl-D-amino-acid deacylase [Nocardiopsis sinuspersici]